MNKKKEKGGCAFYSFAAVKSGEWCRNGQLGESERERERGMNALKVYLGGGVALAEIEETCPVHDSL